MIAVVKIIWKSVRGLTRRAAEIMSGKDTTTSSSSSSSSSKGKRRSAVFAFLCNLTMAYVGAGALGLPYAVGRAGAPVGVAALAVVAVAGVAAAARLVRCREKVLAARRLLGTYSRMAQQKKNR